MATGMGKVFRRECSMGERGVKPTACELRDS